MTTTNTARLAHPDPMEVTMSQPQPFTVAPFDATEAGALSGHAATCGRCGYVQRTSLSAREATRLGWAHADWHARTGR